ncbi:MAG: sensor histidine kinase [Candidatus Sumerlaeia bacterium]
MVSDPATEARRAETRLNEWRCKAVNVFATVSAAAFLLAIGLMVAGLAPPRGWPAQSIVVAAYLSFIVCALPHRINHRTRAWVLLTAGYVVALIHLVTIPQGPFGLALPVMLPILAIVILGARAGWAATVVSTLFFLLGPLLQRVPSLVEALTNAPPSEPTPLNVVLYQGIALVALVVGQMILLDRFYDFLMRSLAGLRREARERAAAFGKLEREMLERRRLEREIARVGDEERRRLGQDVHDGVCQQLTGALLRSHALERQLERGEALKPGDLEALSALLEESIDEAHAVAKGLWPLESDPDALAPALRILAKRAQGSGDVRCEFIASGQVRVSDPATARHLYRIAQEALSNAVRHARAGRIVVELSGDDEQLRLRVQDDGVGPPADIPGRGLGLRTMTYRAQMMEGELAVEPAGERGTRVVCRVPRTERPRKAPEGEVDAS